MNECTPSQRLLLLYTIGLCDKMGRRLLASLLLALAVLIASTGVIWADGKFDIVLKNVMDRQLVPVRVFCLSQAGKLYFLGTTICESDGRQRVISSQMQLTSINIMKEWCAKGKVFVTVGSVEWTELFEKERKASEMQSSPPNEALMSHHPPSTEEDEELVKIERRKAKNRKKKVKRLEKRKAKPMGKMETINEEEEKLGQKMLENVGKSEEENLGNLREDDERWTQNKNEMKLVHDKMRSEQAQQETAAQHKVEDELAEQSLVKVAEDVLQLTEEKEEGETSNVNDDEQEAPVVLKQFELNVLHFIDTSSLILDMVGSMPLALTIIPQEKNDGEKEQKASDGRCPYVLLYCYKTMANSSPSKNLVIFGHTSIGEEHDGSAAAISDHQQQMTKISKVIELGNLDEMANCLNSELFVYIDRGETDEQKKTERVTKKISTRQFENYIEDGKMKIDFNDKCSFDRPSF